MPLRYSQSLADDLPRLLEERGMTLRALASEIGVNQSYLSRVLGPRGIKASRRASPEAARKIALALGLPEDYFPEVREDYVVVRVRNEPATRDRFYRQLRKAR
jgi:transcriptional regulator with XRE-family HTH domain